MRPPVLLLSDHLPQKGDGTRCAPCSSSPPPPCRRDTGVTASFLPSPLCPACSLTPHKTTPLGDGFLRGGLYVVQNILHSHGGRVPPEATASCES